MQDCDDIRLIKRIEGGDRAAFRELTRRHAERAYRVALRITGRREDAEDLVQEAFLKFWREPWRFNPLRNARFSTWLFRVVSNSALNMIKRRRFEMPDSDGLLNRIDPNDLQQNLEQRELRRKVSAAVHALPPRQKQALILCTYEGFSNQEAADIMEMSLNAFQSLLKRTRASLRESLGDPQHHQGDRS